MKVSQLECKNIIADINVLVKKRDTSYLKILQPFTDKDLPDKLSSLWRCIFEAYEVGEINITGVEFAGKVFQSELKEVKEVKLSLKLFFNNKVTRITT